MVSGEDALAWGLIDRIVEDPLAEARLLAVDALGASAPHVAGIKALV